MIAPRHLVLATDAAAYSILLQALKSTFCVCKHFTALCRRQLCSSGDLISLTQPAAAAAAGGPEEAGPPASVLALVESVERDEANRDQYSVQAFINQAPSSAAGEPSLSLYSSQPPVSLC